MRPSFPAIITDVILEATVTEARQAIADNNFELEQARAAVKFAQAQVAMLEAKRDGLTSVLNRAYALQSGR